MLAKLTRELGRLAGNTFDSTNVVDHSINCALTAWHISDWVWQLHFRRNLENQRLLAKTIKTDVPSKPWEGQSPPRQFKASLFKLCDALKHCEDIAIGVKHVYSERTPTRSANVYVSTRTAKPFTLGSSTLCGGDLLAKDDGSVPIEAQYLPKIQMADGSTLEVIQLFDAVLAFWKEFFREFNIL